MVQIRCNIIAAAFILAAASLAACRSPEDPPMTGAAPARSASGSTAAGPPPTLPPTPRPEGWQPSPSPPEIIEDKGRPGGQDIVEDDPSGEKPRTPEDGPEREPQ